MEFINVKGLQIPALGFGTWQLTGDDCAQGVQTALELGYRHIDTAQIYENEAEVGKGIARSGIGRSEVFLTTKIWISNFRAPDVHSSFNESLRKLQTDYVDLLLMHWPNPEVDLAETLGALQELKDAGKVRAMGVSNFPVALMKSAVEELGFDIACNQVEYHVMLSQKPVLEYAQSHDMMLTAYSPLARGNLEKNATMRNVAHKHGKSVSQVALRWLIEQRNVAAIPKASSEPHIRTNFDIFDFTLDAEDKKQIDGLSGNHRLVNPDFAPEWDQAA